MDQWLCTKFCPSFEVRRSGGEEERFASGACSCVMVCYWEFFTTHWDKNNSLVSANLWPAWMGEICSTQNVWRQIYKSGIFHSKVPLHLMGVFPCFYVSWISDEYLRLSTRGTCLLEDRCPSSSVLFQFPSESRTHSNWLRPALNPWSSHIIFW